MKNTKEVREDEKKNGERKRRSKEKGKSAQLVFHTVILYPAPINIEQCLFIKRVTVGFQTGEKIIEWLYNLQYRSRNKLIIASILLIWSGQQNTTRIYMLLDVVRFDECVCICSGFSKLGTGGALDTMINCYLFLSPPRVLSVLAATDAVLAAGLVPPRPLWICTCYVLCH